MIIIKELKINIDSRRRIFIPKDICEKFNIKYPSSLNLRTNDEKGLIILSNNDFVSIESLISERLKLGNITNAEKRFLNKLLDNLK